MDCKLTLIDSVSNEKLVCYPINSHRHVRKPIQILPTSHKFSEDLDSPKMLLIPKWNGGEFISQKHPRNTYGTLAKGCMIK